MIEFLGSIAIGFIVGATTTMALKPRLKRERR
jgi:gas vesicle protein